jgi:hypothetical protein
MGRGSTWADTRPESPSKEVLRSHFKGEDAFVQRTLMDLGYQLPVWGSHYRNCAGDLDEIPEILVEDQLLKGTLKRS